MYAGFHNLREAEGSFQKGSSCKMDIGEGVNQNKNYYRASPTIYIINHLRFDKELLQIWDPH
jgi:hypothetical protein